MKIAYVAHYDIKDVTSGNGTDYFKAKSLENSDLEVDFVYPLNTRLNFFSRCEKKLLERLGYQYPLNLNTSVLRSYGDQLSSNSNVTHSDVVICPTFHTVAYFKSNKPVIIWTDATLANLESLYPDYKKTLPCILREGHKAQKSALENSSLSVFSSEWAAKSAIIDYGIPESKVKVVPFGINFSSGQSSSDLEAIILKRSQSSVCELFFIGFDFFRKGLSKALDTVAFLNSDGIPARLTIVGGEPEISEELRRYVRIIGKVNKLASEGIIKDIFSESHFLLLPTLADCTPMVIAEAFSFGCPAISTNVGGIKSMIEDNVNGVCFPVNASARDYSCCIKQIWEDKSRYHQMCRDAFTKYENIFNWKVAGSRMKDLIHELQN